MMKFLIFAVVLLCTLLGTSAQTICGSKETPTCYDQAGGTSCYSGAIANLQDCDYIQGSEIIIYLSGTEGTAASPEVISFKATAIDGDISVNKLGTSPVALQFDSLQTLNGTLSFGTSFGSSSLSMKSLNCWHSGDGKPTSLVNPSNLPNTTSIGNSVAHGTIIEGSLNVVSSYRQSITVGQISGGLNLRDNSANLTFPKLTYLGSLTATAGVNSETGTNYDMPALKSVGQISVSSGSWNTPLTLKAPALTAFNPYNNALNGTAGYPSTGDALLISNSISVDLILGTYTVTSSDYCNCKTPSSSGFAGCEPLCNPPASQTPMEPMCTLDSIPDLAALLKALLMAIGIIVAIVIGSCIFCCCIIGGGYWASQQRKKLSSQDAQRAQNAVEVTNPVGLAAPPGMAKDVVPEPSSNAV